jgi:hypothetical protein
MVGTGEVGRKDREDSFHFLLFALLEFVEYVLLCNFLKGDFVVVCLAPGWE